jgi:hypothetical protein
MLFFPSPLFTPRRRSSPLLCCHLVGAVCRFEDSDFLGQLRLPEDQRDIKCSVLMREEAVEVWRQYAALPNTVHY